VAKITQNIETDSNPTLVTANANTAVSQSELEARASKIGKRGKSCSGWQARENPLSIGHDWFLLCS